MKRWFTTALFLLTGLCVYGQGVEWLDPQDTYQTAIGQNARIPIRIRNTSDKPLTLTIRKAAGDLNNNQKGYFCVGDECFDAMTDQVTKRLEPGETANNVV